MQDGVEKKPKTPIEAHYANYCDVGHTATEFVLDFGQFYAPEQQQAHMHTRIVTVPSCAKTLLEVLRDNIEQYEHNFGSIHSED